MTNADQRAFAETVFERSQRRDARDPASDRGTLLHKDKHREQCDQKHSHHPAHNQKRHQNPATADAIASVLKPQQQTAFQIAAKAAVAYQELEWRLALGEAGVL